MIQVPQREAWETPAEYWARKEAAFAIWQADALERINELEAENSALRDDKRRRVMALNAARNILNAVSDMILKENFDMPIDTFAKDYAPWINVMAHHGVIEAKTKRRKA